MNKQESDVLQALLTTPYMTQKALAVGCGLSLGSVNKALQALVATGLLDASMSPTEQARQLAAAGAPRHAVILAAGFGMRMVPINMETPKAFLEVKGERLIERQIRQLHAVGVTDIDVVVGFMKESFEYLIDDFGVRLVVNAAYAAKNNLHSLALVKQRLANSYIIPCDVWCVENPFRKQELYSWYMVSECADTESDVRVNRKQELVRVSESAVGNAMLGIAYVTAADAAVLSERLDRLSRDAVHDGAFWEEALYIGDRMLAAARVVADGAAVEVNTYEQLRELDNGSHQLQNRVISIIADSLGVTTAEVRDITAMKKGMTNRSFLFSCRGKRYIMRIPGEGTDQLINRRQEAAVYQAIADAHICDDIYYINPDNGYKITAFVENARVCDADSVEDLTRCMRRLRAFHDLGLQVDHAFDIFGQIDFYESLWEGTPSVYGDYARTKARVLSLRSYIDRHVQTRCLTHIDAVPDNFLICGDEIRLIDWEYAGVQDPHVDIAMFCIYALYDRAQVDRLIDIYFENACPHEMRVKIYCYIAACGLLWSNWCEYKRKLGVEFGEYSLRQYRYAKEYYAIVQQEREDIAHEHG